MRGLKGRFIHRNQGLLSLVNDVICGAHEGIGDVSPTEKGR